METSSLFDSDSDQDDLSCPKMVGSMWGRTSWNYGDELAMEGLSAPIPQALQPLTTEVSLQSESKSEESKQVENIQVMARFRPLNDREYDEDPGGECVEYGGDGKSCTLQAAGSEYEFNFKRVFGPMASQDDIYEVSARPIVAGVVNGYNGAIIAYGQTGSGKTHTMMGPHGARCLIDGAFDDPELGVIPRVLLELQDRARHSDGAVELRVSYLEIYQEHLRDLLSEVKAEKQAEKDIRQDSKSMGLWLPQVVEMPVTTAREAMEIMRIGNKQRTKAATEMNQDSSRSHAIFIVTVVNSIDPLNRKFAQLYLVDLAGSERTSKTKVEGRQLDEAKIINRSLLALGQVIYGLSTNAKHIPYRDSKLTRLLQNCLGGNARTCLLCTASPHDWNALESLSTLRFGDRAAKIKNDPKMNIALNAAELKKLLERAQAELADLKTTVQHLTSENATLRRGSLDVTSASAAQAEMQKSSSPAQPAKQDQVLLPSSSEELAPCRQVELIARRLFVRDLLPAFLCPLTHAVMRDPVCASDGHTYERVAVERLMRMAGRMPAMSPVTGHAFPSKQLVANCALRVLIARHLPDLPQLEMRVCAFSLLSTSLLELIFSFIDGKGLCRAQLACADFLAVGSSSRLWTHLLMKEFGHVDSDQEQKDPRQSYRKLALSRTPPKPPKLNHATSFGLRLHHVPVPLSARPSSK